MREHDRLVEGAAYYESDCEKVHLTRYLNATRVLDTAEDQMHEDIGESAEKAFRAPSEAVQELDALLKSWAEKNLKGEYYMRVEKPRKLTVTIDDMVGYEY